MKLFAWLIALALPGATPPPKDEPGVAAATFRAWRPADGATAWTSTGLRVAIAPAPCAIPENEACRFEGHNNQAVITVRATEQAPFRVRTDDQASYYRIAVVRFDRRDRRPGLVIENASGGSAGNVREELLVPAPGGFRTLWLPESGFGEVQGALPARLTDLSGDGRVDFVLEDGGFGHAYGCNACTPRPPRIFTLRDGRIADVSAEPAYAGVYRRDMAMLAPRCASGDAERNGACAAYVADAARIGKLGPAWRFMLRHYSRKSSDIWQACTVPPAQWGGHVCPPGRRSAYRSFPESLHAFLRHSGYID